MSAVDRYTSCAHRDACDRMASRAKLEVWYSSGESEEESDAGAYGCDVCREWEASHDDA